MQAEERRKELTVRLAIGASRGRITRQLLTESAVLALASGLIGLAIRQPLAGSLLRLLVAWTTRAAQFATSLGYSVVRGRNLGVDGARSGRLARHARHKRRCLPGLQQGSRTATPAPTRRFLAPSVAVAQMALSLVLVSGACLFAFSLHQLRQFDAGVNRDRLLLVEVNPADTGYQDAQLISLNLKTAVSR